MCDPLIAATGYSQLKQLDLARAAGFDAVMVKPCDPQSLVAEIRRQLMRRANDAQTPDAQHPVSNIIP